jgi:hypothetical protein
MYSGKLLFYVFAFFAMNIKGQSTDDLTLLKAINAKFIHNFVTNDVPSHDKILHERFVYINSKGEWVDRQAYLKDWKTGFDGE